MNSHENYTENKNEHYREFFIMILLHFFAMFVLMYAMVDILPNALPNLNQFYMAVLMTSSMIVFEILLMRKMYMNQKWNMMIVTGGLLLLVGSFFFIRQQTAINDTQFLRSMIPHHAGAILMCEKASLEDVEIKELCDHIAVGQQEEIEQMKEILERLED